MTRQNARADGELLAATRRDPEAFAEFYARYSHAVLGYFMNRTRRADLAADLTAETFAAALESAHRYRAEGATAVAWLIEIARNKLIDSIRRGRVEDAARRRLGMRPLELDDALDALETRLDFAAHERWLEEMLISLPPAHREAILAHVVDERTYAELSAELDISEAVVRKRVSRGLRALRSRLSEQR
jgi:RNA polymerase sigma-70 factor (ECF subfamily)